MGRKVKKLKNYTPEQIEKLFESGSKHELGVKLYAVLQLSRGYSSRKLSEFYRTSFKQICTWADRLDADGIKGLQIKPGRGKKSRLSEAQKAELQSDLLESPEKFGYNTATWSGAVVLNFVQKKFAVTYKIAAIYKILHQLGFSFQRAKAVYPERDEQAREAAKADIKKR
jgi:transposase